MRIEHRNNIFDELSDAVCITTNGIVCKCGAVMGSGIAKEANNRYKLCHKLGYKLMRYGNHVFDLGVFDNKHILTFPTKHHWRDPSDIELIKQSCYELIALVNSNRWQTVLLPAVGCGCGGLRFSTEVEPIISQLLDDRFIICIRR